MLTALWSAVGLALITAVVSLALGLLLASRYRELHRTVTNRVAVLAPDEMEPFPATGAAISDFQTTTTTGEPVGAADFAQDEVLVAFLMVGCEPCKRALPQLRRVITDRGPGLPQPVAVVIGSGEEAADYITDLAPIARVISEPSDGPTVEAFGVRTYPAFVLAGAGSIRQVGTSLDTIGVAVPA